MSTASKIFHLSMIRVCKSAIAAWEKWLKKEHNVTVDQLQELEKL